MEYEVTDPTVAMTKASVIRFGINDIFGKVGEGKLWSKVRDNPYYEH